MECRDEGTRVWAVQKGEGGASKEFIQKHSEPGPR